MSANLHSIQVARIIGDPTQPRKVFDQAGLDQLAESLRQDGLLQPISVRPHGEGYIVIAGERRLRAARQLGWEAIPALVHDDISMRSSRRLQVLENVVRRDLNPVEEARAYQGMMDEGHTMQEVASTVGLPVSQVSWRVQMLQALPQVLDLVAQGHMKPSLAHEMSKLSPAGQMVVLRKVQSDHLTYQECIWICERQRAGEQQTSMFGGSVAAPKVLSSGERRAAAGFMEAFEKASGAFETIFDLEQKRPGTLAAALAAELPVAEQHIREMQRFLGFLERSLHRERVEQRALGS